MNAPLLATKLHVPRRRPSSVERARLTDALAAPVKLVLVAAPAGFGKTSILSEWLSTLAEPRVAWLSLDENDDEPQRFWTYLLTAVDGAAPGSATSALAQLSSGAPQDTVLATLINDLHARDDELILVLDDLHVIETPAVHAGLAFLIDNLPARVRVIVASRSDPALPLGRLRAQGDLTEIRAADLRFTHLEAASYLNEVMGLTIGDADVAALGGRTEGWIAALQLAAISMQGRDDPGEFIAGFAGDDRFVVDYLVEEVLQRQTDATRAFLLDTSILGRLSGDLCDAVLEARGSGATLEALDRANLFLVPLDEHREWFRYHHLFAEMLRARLRDERTDHVEGLHLRASEWFELAGDSSDAVRHALDARAFGRAAALITSAAPAMQQQRHELTLVGWLDELPADIVRSAPELGILSAGVRLSAGRTEGVDRLLADAEAAAGEATSGEAAAGVLAIRRGLALYRAAQAMTAGDFAEALEHSGAAVELSRDGSHIDRGSAHGIRGLVLWAVGDLEDARTTWAVSLDELRRAGHLADTLGGSIAMGDILIAQGRLTAAAETFRQGIALAHASTPPLRGAADMHVGLADVLRERGDLEGAGRELDAAVDLGEYAGLPQNRHRRRIAAARLLQAQGDPAAGIPLLDEAENLYTPDFFPEVRPIDALRTRALLAAGRATEVREWQRGLSLDHLSYLREFTHITLVRLMLAADDVAVASGVIDRLLAAAESGGRNGAVIELLALQALAMQRHDRRDEALEHLARAVALAEPEGYVRVFADEGRPMAQLLAALAKRDGMTSYLRRLQSAATGTRVDSPQPAEPLSERELDVLRLLASDLSGPDIARHLVVSLNTLRTHTKNIYTKLGATSRREAVRRAGELGMLNPSR